MKTRLSFALWAGLLTMILIVGLLPSPQTPAATVTASATSTPSPAPTQTQRPFVPFPTHFSTAASLTPIPRQATYTSLAAETPDVIASATLLPVFTPTLVFFATLTATPFGGSATPPVPVAATLDGKPATCYKGPSLAYIEIDAFKIARIVGYNAAEKWWYLLVYKGQGVYVNCWVADAKVSVSGNLSGLSETEPELPQITRVQVTISGQPARGVAYIQPIACEAGLSHTTLHFTGQIFADGPIKDIGYIWKTNAPTQFQIEHTSVQAWDAPAQIAVDLSVPARAGSYFISLRTTFPMEVLGEWHFTLMCQ